MRVLALFVMLLTTVGCSVLSTREHCVEFLGEIDRDYNPVVPVLFEWNGGWYAAMCGQKQGDTSILFLLQNIYVQEDKQEFIIATPGKFYPVNFKVVPIDSEILHLFFHGGLAEEGNELESEVGRGAGGFREVSYKVKSTLLFCELKPHNQEKNSNRCEVVPYDNPLVDYRDIPGGCIKVYKGPSNYIVYWVNRPMAGDATERICWYSSSTRQVQQIEAKDCRDVWLHSSDSGPAFTILLWRNGSEIRRMPLAAGDMAKSERVYWTNSIIFLLHADDQEYAALKEDCDPCLLDVKRNIITKITSPEGCGNTIRVLNYEGGRYLVFTDYSESGIHIRRICPGGLSVQEQFIPFGVRDASIDSENYAIIGQDFVFLFDKDCPERDTRQFCCRSAPLIKE
jgi:hypothetical protein